MLSSYSPSQFTPHRAYQIRNLHITVARLSEMVHKVAKASFYLDNTYALKPSALSHTVNADIKHRQLNSTAEGHRSITEASLDSLVLLKATIPVMALLWQRLGPQ